MPLSRKELSSEYRCKGFLLCLLPGETPALLTDSQADLSKLSEEVHTFAFDILFGQLKGYLANLANMEVCCCANTNILFELAYIRK